MNVVFDELFENRTSVPKALSDHGFTIEDGRYVLNHPIPGGRFILNISICNDIVSTELTDMLSREGYIMHVTDSDPEGMNIARECRRVLRDISVRCFTSNVFIMEQSQEVLRYAMERYGDMPEFLWKRSPDNAILRRRGSGKWYAALLKVKGSRIGLDTDEKVEILNLKADGMGMPAVDGEIFLPGYHMNKKSWYTVVMNNSVEMDSLKMLIDTSHRMAV